MELSLVKEVVVQSSLLLICSLNVQLLLKFGRIYLGGWE
jgi:hypothetical protein